MSDHKKLDPWKKDPAIVSIISKLVDDPHKRGKQGANGEITPPSDPVLNKISIISQNNISDAKSIFQLLPDMELAKQILIASIISPNNLIDNELNFSLSDEQFDSTIASSLMGVVEGFFVSDYKIKKLLPTILEDILFYRGSYPIAILPESTIDQAINSHERVSMESIREFFDDKGHFNSIGLLGSPKEKSATAKSVASLEGLLDIGLNNISEYTPVVGEATDDKHSMALKVIDNPSILKLPFLRRKAIHEQVMTKLNVKSLGMESRKEFKTTDDIKMMERVLYQPRQYYYTPAQALVSPSKGTRDSHGNPMAMLLPSESVIPIHSPGDETSHVGYFVLLDPQGNPLNTARRSDYYNDMVNSLALKPEHVQTMIATNFPVQQGRFDVGNRTEFNELVGAYTSVVEQDLLKRLRNGLYGEHVEISKPHEVFRIMLARSMAKKQTQLLFIPSELMVYMAFDYNEYGVGKSLVEDTKILASLRIMMLFANTMAGIKNSVGRTGIQITLDPEDHEPANTVEMLVHEYARTRQMAYPIGAASPLDIIDFLQRAAIDVHVTGNPRYPETAVEVVDKQANRTTVDTALDEELKKRHISSFGIAPETVDLGLNVEFATSIVSSNILLSKRVKVYQDKISFFLKELITKFVLYSGTLMNELREIIENNRDKIPEYIKDKYKQDGKEVTVDADSVIAEFLNVLEVTLPEPESVKLENQMTAYEIYERSLDKALEAWISTSVLDSEVLGKVGGNIDQLLATVKARYLRQYQRTNNFMPELANMVTTDVDGKPVMNLLEEQIEFNKSLMETIGGYMEKLGKARAESDLKVDNAAEALEKKYGPQDEFGGTSDMGGSDTMDDGTDDLTADLDDGDLDSDLTGDDIEGETTEVSDDFNLDDTSSDTTEAEDTPSEEISSAQSETETNDFSLTDEESDSEANMSTLSEEPEEEKEEVAEPPVEVEPTTEPEPKEESEEEIEKTEEVEEPEEVPEETTEVEDDQPEETPESEPEAEPEIDETILEEESGTGEFDLSDDEDKDADDLKEDEENTEASDEDEESEEGDKASDEEEEAEDESEEERGKRLAREALQGKKEKDND